MRIFLVVGGLHTESSGVARIVTSQAHALQKAGHEVTIYTAVCRGQTLAEHMVGSRVRCVGAKGSNLFRLAHSPALARRLSRDMPRADVVHNQSLWMLPTTYSSSQARHYDKPYLFTTHGFLEPWALAHSGWKKRLVARWFQDRDLRGAACIHVNSTAEMQQVREYGLTNPIAVIPNGIDLNAFNNMPSKAALREVYPELKGKRVALFLYRLHPKKGVMHLVEAWNRVRRDHQEWHVVIAGPDDGDGEQVVQAVRDLDLEKSVSIVGTAEGERKLELLSAADLLVLPSFSEGFSMVVLEAMACCLPVIITPGCNFPEAIEGGAGIQIDPTVESVEEGLRKMLALSEGELLAMGRRGRSMIEASYTWDYVAGQLLDVYRWLAEGGAKPDMVMTR